MQKLPTKNEILKFQERTAEDPEWFIKDVLKTDLWEKEKEIVKSVRDNKITAVRSCNTSGKSYTAGRIANAFLVGYSDSIVLTTAPTWRQVKEILWREIKSSAAGKGIYPIKAVLETMIKLSEKWFALGLSTNKPDQFQGFHAERLLVIGDESSGIADVIHEAIDGLTPYRILLLGNPLRNTGRFADSFKDPNVNKIHISAFDTPNLVASGITTLEDFKKGFESNTLPQNKIVIPGLMTLDDVVAFARKYGIESDVFGVRVEGEFPKAEADSYIGLNEVEAATNRDPVEVRTEKIMGVDTARFGDDRTVLQMRQGDNYGKKVVMVKKDAPYIASQIIILAEEEKVKPENIKVDVIGTNGLSVVHLLEAEGWVVTEVNFAEAALNPDPNAKEQFANLRAECYDHVKTSLKNGSLPRDEEYWELANIRYFYNQKGQTQLEKKEDMKKRGLLSPDVGDACAITWAPIEGRARRVKSGSGYKSLFPEMGSY